MRGTNGDRDLVSYHLYLGVELRKKETLMVVHFATRTVLVHGERLGPYVAAFQHRRRHVAELAVSCRRDLMKAETDNRPVITAIEVCTPKVGELRLNAALAETPPGALPR